MEDTNYPYIVQNKGPRFQGIARAVLNEPLTDREKGLVRAALIKLVKG